GADARRAGRPVCVVRPDRDDRGAVFHGPESERIAGYCHEDQHGVTQSVCYRLPANRSGTRWQMAQNQDQAAATQGTPSAYGRLQKRLLRPWALAQISNQASAKRTKISRPCII